MTRIIARLQRIAVTQFQGLVGRARRQAPTHRNPRTALMVMKKCSYRDTLKAILEEQGWRVIFAETIAEVQRIDNRPCAVVFYDRAVSDNWGAELLCFSRLSPRPCVVLISETGDENLWDELARYGGLGIIRIPVDRDQVIHTLQSAWALWCTHERVRASSRVRF